MHLLMHNLIGFISFTKHSVFSRVNYIKIVFMHELYEAVWLNQLFNVAEHVRSEKNEYLQNTSIFLNLR